MVAGEIYNKRILFGVLNWGLGHATRSSALIKQLIKQNNQVTLVSAGAALQYLQKTFPQLEIHTMPAREIFYPAHRQLWLKLLLQQRKIFGNISTEKKALEQLSPNQKPHLIISDNCYGFYQPHIHSILLTHQVNIQSPFLQKAAQKRIHHLLQPFHEIWIPDMEGEQNLAGHLSHPGLSGKPCTYIGPLSGLEPKNIPAQKPFFEYCAIISGPEKQRTLFEEQVIRFLLTRFHAPAMIIRGTQTSFQNNLPHHIHVRNTCTARELQNIVAMSNNIIGRTGYSTIMDMYSLQKPCILLPTPGQTEQEYLFYKHFGKVPQDLFRLQPRHISTCKN